MKNTDAYDSELFHPDSLEMARDHYKSKLANDFHIAGNELVKMAIKAVLKPEAMTSSEKIFHESALHYNIKRDSPNAKIKTYNEWKATEMNG